MHNIITIAIGCAAGLFLLGLGYDLSTREYWLGITIVCVSYVAGVTSR